MPVSRWILVMLLAALAGGCDRAADAGRDGDKPIRIVYWTRAWWGDPAQYQGEDPISVPLWQRQQIERFEAMHPNVKVDMQIDPGGRGDKIRMAFAGGVAPDVFHGAPDTEFISWAALGLLEPIDTYLSDEDRKDIFEAALEATEYRGLHYAWPLYNHALCVAINRDLFRERGLEHRIPGPDATWTMEEFHDLAKQLTFDRDGDGRTDVYGVGLHCLDANHVFLTTYLMNFGARVFDDAGYCALSEPAGVEGLRFLRRLIDDGCATPGAAGYKYDDMRSLFAQQRVAMYLTSAGILIWANDQARKGTVKPFDWALAPVPRRRGEDPISFLTVGTVFVSRQTDTAKRDACMALAKFLTGTETNRYFWRMASPRRSSPLPEQEYLAVMMRQVEYAQNFMLPPRPLSPRFNLSEHLNRVYQDVLAVPPKRTPEATLREFCARVNRAVEESADEP